MGGVPEGGPMLVGPIGGPMWWGGPIGGCIPGPLP